MNSADKCRANGWGPGTLLVGDEGYGPTVIRVTAVGEKEILARIISHNGDPDGGCECNWTLEYRDWKRVTPAEAAKEGK